MNGSDIFSWLVALGILLGVAAFITYIQYGVVGE